MSVFISYNRNDEEFVDKLSKTLVYHNVPVWRDNWQIRLGESIITNIEDALEKASFVCIVLSKNALQSEWVKRELRASLTREFDKEKLSILPLIIDDCKIPLFIRDKLYADFRKEKDFDAGVKMILNAVADKYNLFAGKFTNEGKSTSFGTDVFIYKEKIEINLDIISEDDDSDYFILTKVKFIGNDKALEQFQLYQEDGEASNFIREVVGICNKNPEISNKRITIGGKEPAQKTININSGVGGLHFTINFLSKKIGPDNGKYVLFNLGQLFQFYEEQYKK